MRDGIVGSIRRPHDGLRSPSAGGDNVYRCARFPAASGPQPRPAASTSYRSAIDPANASDVGGISVCFRSKGDAEQQPDDVIFPSRAVTPRQLEIGTQGNLTALPILITTRSSTPGYKSDKTA